MATYSNIETGKRITEKRKYFKYTIEKLSELLGISPRFLSAIERGEKGMSYNTLEKMCNTLCVTSDYLLFGKTEDTSNNTKNEIYNITKILSSIDSHYLPLAESTIKNLVETISIVTKNVSKNRY